MSYSVAYNSCLFPESLVNFLKKVLFPGDADTDKKLYELVKSGEYASAFELIEDLKNQPDMLKQVLLYSNGGKTVFRLLLEEEATSKSQELISAIIDKMIDSQLEENIRNEKPFFVALQKKYENGHFNYLLVKHPIFLTFEQMELCLTILCNKNDGDGANQLLNAIDEKTRYALIKGKIFSVIDSNNDRIFRVFIKLASIMEFRYDGDTLLHYLVKRDKCTFLIALTAAQLKETCSLLEVKNSAQRTVLQEAASKSHKEFVKIFLGLGANFMALTSKGELTSQLAGQFLCIRSGAKILLENAEYGFFTIRDELRESLKSQTMQRRTLCFFRCLREQKIDLAMKLITLHCEELDKWMRDPDTNESAPLIAVKMNSFDLLSFLKKTGWSLEDDFEKMIFSAAENRQFKVVNYLLDNIGKFDLNSANENGETLLNVLIRKNNLVIAHRLVGPEFAGRFDVTAHNQLLNAFINLVDKCIDLSKKK